MSLKSKIEAVIYASEEPVTLPQLVGLLAEEVQGELDRVAALQVELPLGEDASMQAAPLSDVSLREETPISPGLDGWPPPEPDTGGSDESASASIPIPVADDQPGEPPGPTEAEKRHARERERAVREYLRRTVDELMREYSDADRGIEVREVAGGFRMGTKPEYHDAVRGFVKSLKPVLKLSLQALETLAVVAYKQPVTAAEISEIRGVDSAGVLGGLMTRKLIATAGRKQVIGRPMLYKTTKEFLVRFGLKDVQELPSMEEFERLAGELAEQEDLPMERADILIERANARGDAEHVRETTEHLATDASTDTAEATDEQATDTEDSLDEQPSEALVAEVLGVGRDEPGTEDATTDPASADRDQGSLAPDAEALSPPLASTFDGNGTAATDQETADRNTTNQMEDQMMADQETAEPIEAVAAMQAEQTSALAVPFPSPGSGTEEREPQ